MTRSDISYLDRINGKACFRNKMTGFSVLLPHRATQSNGAGLWRILIEILVYGIGELCAKHNREYNVFLHEPFFVDSLKWAILEENRSIKVDLETFLRYFLRNVNYLAWPDPLAPRYIATKHPPADNENFGIGNRGEK